MYSTYNKHFFEKVFSDKRMKKYFDAHPDPEKAILHYQCNIEVAESFYPCITVFEVALRNSINRELETFFGREDWYTQIPTTAGLASLNKYVNQANKQITNRKEQASPSKIVAELTLGFWVSLFNTEYELILWKDLRRAFPYMPKSNRKRKNVSAPLNNFRNFRNRIFHHEPICWNFKRLTEIHDEMLMVINWINKDIPAWIQTFDKFKQTLSSISQRLSK